MKRGRWGELGVQSPTESIQFLGDLSSGTQLVHGIFEGSGGICLQVKSNLSFGCLYFDYAPKSVCSTGRKAKSHH